MCVLLECASGAVIDHGGFMFASGSKGHCRIHTSAIIWAWRASSILY
jgi:hypothetical protein